MNPPRTEDELLGRALSLEGRRLDSVAEHLGVSVPPDLRRHKGWVGELLELTLGATGGHRAACDFPELGVELKTLPVDHRGRPRESTCVCVASLGPESLLPWEDCWLRAKLARVLWVPVIGAGSPGSRVVGRSVLWSPSSGDEAMLRADWEEITGRLGLGHFDEIDASWGEVLQVRPKAANRRERTWAMSAEAEWVQVNPRGFYLRSRFTQRILLGEEAQAETNAETAPARQKEETPMSDMNPLTEAEARAQGYKRCFVAEEPRLSDMVEAYREIGLEVVTLPVDLEDGPCNECLRLTPERYRVIYTRDPRSHDHG